MSYPIDFKFKKTRPAILTRAIRGKFSRWKKGERVNAVHLAGSSYAIEKLKWNRQGLPITHQCFGISQSALKFN